MLERLLPVAAASSEAFADLPGTRLHPAERELADTFSARRRAEFATVRDCARGAGRLLGLAPFPLLPSPTGSPHWPRGVVGSLTHCPNYRAAAVARDTAVRALGIDAEPHRPLPPGMLARIALPAELRDQETLRSADADVCWDRLLFCAKEAVYKVWSPLTGSWLGFHEASVRLHAAPRTFTARLLRDSPATVPTVLAGRWTADAGLLITAVTVRP
ncbi:4'-phosphopantetheinyl transferase [Streptomyces sp. NPDC059496]|uniref:4'-phosphopantetheinyl transferase family protein n=1 Tax=Streptomyces sp. NPDC059496 TaxID=3346851 RepID=UPI0036CC2061